MRGLAIALAALAICPCVAAGTFTASDPTLNAAWALSVRSAEDMLAPGGQTLDALGRWCPTPSGRTVILDGVERDRCPYVGDESIIGLTLDAATPHWSVQRDMIRLFADGQYPSGAIPASPLDGGIVLYDYVGYWVLVLRNYVLYSGDVGFGREMWPRLVRVLDTWYPSQTGPQGLLVNTLGRQDYGYIRRRGDVLSYYNAQYVYLLRQAAEFAGWLGFGQERDRWLARAAMVGAAFGLFWDGSAWTDSTADRLTHPQDGNSFAVLARLGTSEQRRAALAFLETHNAREYGNSITDVDAWDDASWGFQSNLRVYPFMSYFEVRARFEEGLDESALGQIRRTWGYMAQHGPRTTTWEVIGPYGGGPTDHWPSWDAGWSSGGAPLLTEYVLGVRPLSPGYATFAVRPHVVDLEWAAGTVETPHGRISVSWKLKNDRPVVVVQAPAGTRRVK